MVPPQPEATVVRPHPLALFAAITPLLGVPVQARDAPTCHDHHEVARQLAAAYDEIPVSIGLEGDGNLLQVFSSARTGSWTMVRTMPDGIACIVAAGSDWQQRPTASTDPAA